MQYKSRTTAPSTDNQYYYGNINPWNKKGINKSCTTYAQGRILENEALAFGTSKKVYHDTWYPVDMFNRCAEVGAKKCASPIIGGGVVWKSASLPTGHIAIIEKVEGDVISFSQWDTKSTFTVGSAKKSEGYVFNSMTLVGFFDCCYGFEEPDVTPVQSVTYFVQAGAYSVLSNAKTQYNKIKKAGFDCIVKYDGNYYRLQCGAYSIKKNAEYQARQLNAKGFSTFITTNIPGSQVAII